MRLKNIYLENFLRMEEGTGHKEIMLDFDPAYQAGLKRILFMGRNGSGKALPVDSQVFTSNGIRTIGTLEVGDKIISPTGRPVKVLGVYPQGSLKSCLIEFQDGVEIEASPDHIFSVVVEESPGLDQYIVNNFQAENFWAGVTPKFKYKPDWHSFQADVKLLQKILLLENNEHAHVAIPLTDPVQFKSRHVTRIDPYLMGIILASWGSNGILEFGANEDVVANCYRKLNEIGPNEIAYAGHNGNIEPTGYLIELDYDGKVMTALKESYKELYESEVGYYFIPSVYKFNSINTRLSLLQGLFDIDGEITNENKFAYYKLNAYSKALVEDICFIIHSLGGLVYNYKELKSIIKDARYGKMLEEVEIKFGLPKQFKPFTAFRHEIAYRTNEKVILDSEPTCRIIERITDTNHRQRMVCIKVDDPDELFLTDNFIVTHNTTLMRACSPFPTLGDDRTIIVPGRPGRKIVNFVDNAGTEVRCDIMWNSKGKASHMMYLGDTDQPVPETAKGNLGEYLNAVKTYLNVTPDYLKVGLIGGRIDGFLGLGPGKRKEYIGTFMPEIEDWVTMHKNASKRLQLVKAQINGMQVELNRIEPRNELEIGIKRLQDEKTRLTNELRENDLGRGKVDGVISQLTPTIDGYKSALNLSPRDSISEGVNILKECMKAEKAAKSAIEAMIEKRPALAKFSTTESLKNKMHEVESGIYKLEGEIEGKRNHKLSLRTMLDQSIANEQKVKSTFKRASNSSSDLEALKKQKEELDEGLEKLLEMRTRDFGSEELTYDMVSKAVDVLMSLEGETISFLRGLFPSPDSLDRATAMEMEPGKIQAEGSRLQIQLNLAKDNLAKIRDRIASIDAQRQFSKRFSGMHCKDPNCPFENYVAQFATVDEELKEKKATESSLLEKCKEIEAQLEEIPAMKAAAASVKASFTSMYLHKKVLVTAGVFDEGIKQEDALKLFIELINAPAQFAATRLSVEKLLASVRIERDIQESERVLDGIEMRIRELTELAESRADIENAVIIAGQAVADCTAQWNEAANAYDAITKQLQTQQAAHALLENFSSQLTAKEATTARVTEVEEILNRSAEITTLWEKLTGEVTEFERARTEITKSIDSVESSLGDLSQRLARRDDYEVRLFTIDKSLRNLKSISEACHPARGAPVEFLREFMDSTLEEVNKMLDVAFEGDFRISFELNDSEFRIPVMKGTGRIIPDVRDASDGQFALAKTVICLALIKQLLSGMHGYNIVCLDEVDGPLDKEKNRERFADIVQHLADELGLEQILMVSHNDNFHAAPAGLVLLPGHSMPMEESFLSNKEILLEL